MQYFIHCHFLAQYKAANWQTAKLAFLRISSTMVTSPWIWTSHLRIGWEAIAIYRALSDTGIHLWKTAVRWQTLHKWGRTALDTSMFFLSCTDHVTKHPTAKCSAYVNVQILERPLQYLLTSVANHKCDLLIYWLITYSLH